LTGACTTHGASGCELALGGATSFVARVTDGTLGKFASGGVAADISGTALLTTTIAIFTFLDNAVATLVATDGNNPLVVGETARLDGIPAEGTADVAY